MSTRNSARSRRRAGGRSMRNAAASGASGPTRRSSARARSPALRANGPRTGSPPSAPEGEGSTRGGVCPRKLDDPVARLVAEYAAEMRRHADRAADDPSRTPAPRSPRPAPPPRRPTSRPACGRDPRGCWWSRRCRCRSASRRGRAARWSCRSDTAPAALRRCTAAASSGARQSLKPGCPRWWASPATL